MVSKELTFKAELREDTGTKTSAKLRNDGKIPAVVYGHKQAPEHIAINLHNFESALLHGNRLFDIAFGGKNVKLLVKEVQYDHLGKNVIHADFIRVNLSEKVKVEVALTFKGTPAGVAEGGIVEEHLSVIEIECTVVDIPETIELSVKKLNIGDNLHASDIKLPGDATLVTDPEALIIVCQPPIAEAEPEEEGEDGEESATPEVITERKPDEAAE